MAAARAVVNPWVTGKSKEDGHLSGGVSLRLRRDGHGWLLCPKSNHGDLFPMRISMSWKFLVQDLLAAPTELANDFSILGTGVIFIFSKWIFSPLLLEVADKACLL